MGLILDTSVLIASERRGNSIPQILEPARRVRGEDDVALSVITVVELTHGIYRARTEADRERRRWFAEIVFQDFVIQPVTLELRSLLVASRGKKRPKETVLRFRTW